MEEKQDVRLLRVEVGGSWETKKYISLVKAAGLRDVLMCGLEREMLRRVLRLGTK